MKIADVVKELLIKGVPLDDMTDEQLAMFESCCNAIMTFPPVAIAMMCVDLKISPHRLTVAASVVVAEVIQEMQRRPKYKNLTDRGECWDLVKRFLVGTRKET